MKRLIFIVVILFIQACSYVVINFFFFDMWVIHSSEQQLNQSIQHHDTKQLHKIAKDKQTYQFLKTIKKPISKMRQITKVVGLLVIIV